ncbi:hypothetical protein AAC387_Pa02g2129 [Persea americana]
MAASLTITFDENKYQVMLQEKQNKRTHKHPASCRSVTYLGNSQNTGSTSTPRTIVFGSLGPFPFPVEEPAPAKKQKTAPDHVTAMTPKAITKNPKARGNPTKPRPARNQVCPKTWSPRPSPKQRRSRTSTKPAFLAPLKENRFYPLSYMKEEKPTLCQTKSTTISRLAPTSTKSNHASPGLDKNLPGPALLHLNPSSQQGPSLQILKLHWTSKGPRPDPIHASLQRR